MNKLALSTLLLALAALGVAETSYAQANEQTTAGMVSDNEFLRRASAGGMAEVRTSQLAQQRAFDIDVRSLADQMIVDHQRANGLLGNLARAKRVDLPGEIESAPLARLDALGRETGDAFDRAFLDALRTDHEAMISLFRTEATTGGDADVRQFATDMLPTLQAHLDHVQRLQARR